MLPHTCQVNQCAFITHIFHVNHAHTLSFHKHTHYQTIQKKNLTTLIYYYKFANIFSSWYKNWNPALIYLSSIFLFACLVVFTAVSFKLQMKHHHFRFLLGRCFILGVVTCLTLKTLGSYAAMWLTCNILDQHIHMVINFYSAMWITCDWLDPNEHLYAAMWLTCDWLEHHQTFSAVMWLTCDQLYHNLTDY